MRWPTGAASHHQSNTSATRNAATATRSTSSNASSTPRTCFRRTRDVVSVVLRLRVSSARDVRPSPTCQRRKSPVDAEPLTRRLDVVVIIERSSELLRRILSGVDSQMFVTGFSAAGSRASGLFGSVQRVTGAVKMPVVPGIQPREPRGNACPASTRTSTVIQPTFYTGPPCQDMSDAYLAGSLKHVPEAERGCPKSRRTLSGGPPAPSAAVGSVLGD